MADAGNELSPKPWPGPGLRHPHEAAEPFFTAVPGELDFDPAEFVSMDLLANRTDDGRRLRTLHHRPQRQPRRTVGIPELRAVHGTDVCMCHGIVMEVRAGLFHGVLD